MYFLFLMRDFLNLSRYSSSITPSKFPRAPLWSTPSCHFWPLAITDLVSVLIVLPFPENHISRIIQYVTFWVWLLSLSIMLLIFIHVVPCRSMFFLMLNSIPLYGYTTFVYPLINWRTFNFFLLNLTKIRTHVKYVNFDVWLLSLKIILWNLFLL